MKMSHFVVACCLLGTGAVSLAQPSPVVKAESTTGVLSRDEAEKLMPASVFYRGQTATTQGRNAAGFRVESGKVVVAAIVDTGGYSTGVAQRYQAYLITEVRLRVGNKTLVPGSYGFGFVAPEQLLVMDIGDNEILRSTTTRNEAMKRPVPLQILSENGEYRLYLGRSYVTVTPDGEK